MKITIDIDSAVVDELLRMTGEKKKGPAIAKAVAELVRRKKAKEFGKLLREGELDYPLSNDEIEKRDV